jgi:hypothetical protein
MGISAAALSKDRHGKSTLRLHKNASLPISQNKNRKLRVMSKYADMMTENTLPGKIRGHRFTFTRAASEPLAMLEMLATRNLEDSVEMVAATPSNRTTKSLSQPKIHPLKMIATFKSVLKSDEEILRFDLFTLNERCVELLRKVQAPCIEQSPLDYPADEYGGDSKLNSCFSHMLAGVLGLERHQPTRFEEACDVVKQIVESEGKIEYRKAKIQCFIIGDGNKKITDPFHTPPEDNFLFYQRPLFSRIVIVDGPPGSEVTII